MGMRAGEAGEAPSGEASGDRPLNDEEMTLSETRRKYRKFTGRQKLELVMASLRGERSIAELCREHGLSETLLRRWRDVALEAAGERLAGGQDRSVQGEQRKRIAELERALGKKTYELEVLGNGFRAWE